MARDKGPLMPTLRPFIFLAAAALSNGISGCTEPSCEETLTCVGTASDAHDVADASIVGTGVMDAGAPPDAGDDIITVVVPTLPPPEVPCDGVCDSSSCCDGECVDTTSSEEHCGACGTVCDPDNALALCMASECQVAECLADHLDCNADATDGCEVELGAPPTTPLLELPAVGAYTGSPHARLKGTLRPTFTWRPSVGTACELSYRIQLDDSCMGEGLCQFASPEIDEVVTGVSFRPANDLSVRTSAVPVGARYTWRVQACDELDRCSAWSAAHYVFVGRVAEDINGDGYADLAVTEDTANLRVYLGAPTATLTDSVSLYMGDPHGGQRPRWLGDVNGDGFADLGYASRLTPTNAERVAVLLGNSDVSGATYLLRFRPDIAPTQFEGGQAFTSVDPLGDRNADGLADFGVSAVPGGPFVYAGSVALALPITDVLRQNTHSDQTYGGSVGDLTGDGIEDVALVTEETLSFYPGQRNSFDLVGVSLEAPPTCATPQVRSGGDLDGDGTPDFVVVCGDGAPAVAYFGGDGVSDTYVVAEDVVDALLVDLDGDGSAELLLSYTDGTLRIFAGGANFAPRVDAGDAGTEERDAEEPVSFLSPGDADVPHDLTSGDYNGDGTPDVAYRRFASRVYWIDGAVPLTAGTALGSASNVVSATAYHH